MFVVLNKRFNIAFPVVILSVILLGGCSGEEEKEDVLSGEPKIKHASIDTAELHGSLENNDFSPRLSPNELLDNFNYCRDNAETDFTCKFYIAKAICEYYGIEDFKSGDSFVNYEEIRSIVENNEEWEQIGPATDQNVLEKAQLQANKGIPTIGIYTNDTYGHVVIITKGNLSKAKNWNNLMVPICASFFMVEKPEPFVNKSMAYAFSSPESVYLYTKK